MNIDNRRLREIQREKIFYKNLRIKSTDEHMKSVYLAKIQIIEKEELEILKRHKVKV